MTGQATTAASNAATTARAGTPAAAGSPAAPASTAIVIPDTGAKLPAEAVKFQVTVQGTGPRSPFYKAFFEAYRKAHPNITVQFDELPAGQISQAIPLAIQNGTAPDIFWLPSGVTGGQAVQQNWIAPLDDVIPNFQQWKAAFPPGALVEGITMFNGKVYTFPLSSLQRYATLIFYNPDFMKQAGYDPTGKPFTWDEFRAACKKLTQQGAGKYYGLVLGGSSTDTAFGSFVSNFAEMAGAAGGELNWQTGEYNYTSDQFLAATDLLLALKQDNSILPGILSLTQRDATTRHGAGHRGDDAGRSLGADAVDRRLQVRRRQPAAAEQRHAPADSVTRPAAAIITGSQRRASTRRSPATSSPTGAACRARRPFRRSSAGRCKRSSQDARSAAGNTAGDQDDEHALRPADAPRARPARAEPRRRPGLQRAEGDSPGPGRDGRGPLLRATVRPKGRAEGLAGPREQANWTAPSRRRRPKARKSRATTGSLPTGIPRRTTRTPITRR